MIKYFCDICGREINIHRTIVMAFRDSETPNSFVERSMDSCEKCYNELRNKYGDLGTNYDYKRGLFT